MNDPVTIAKLVNTRVREASEALGMGDFLVPRMSWSFGEHEHFSRPRGYGVMYEGPDDWCRMVFSPKVLVAPLERVDGVVRHEIGHCISYIIRGADLDEWAKRRGYRLPPKRYGELRADTIAEAIWRWPLSYDALLVQTTGAGIRPRPAHLGW